MGVVGFDFGTTNSLVSVIKGGRAINLLDDDGLPFPSVISYEGGKTIVGREAKERLSEAGLGIKGITVRSPKILLGRESVFIEGVEHNPVDIVSDVVSYIASQVKLNRLNKDVDVIERAVVTIPVDMEGYRRAALRDAFRIAGISIEQFVHEPLAALYGFFRSQDDMEATLRQHDRKLIMVFDWGGGTLDLTLCRLMDGILIQVANDGTEEVGGDVFDDTIKNEIVRRVQKARDLDEDVKIQPDALTRLLHRCERAKIDLSTRHSVELYVPSFFHGVEDEDLDYSLTREELDSITRAQIDNGFSRISNILEAAGVSSAQISACLATGGMANMPAIKARLHEMFGAQRVLLSSSSGTLVAEGAAWIAHDLARLHLAKNIELLLARNSYMSLVKANTIMPREGEVQSDNFHLYCSDPRDGHAKFQLCVPVRHGAKVLPNDRRNPLATLILEVDEKARPFHERLEMSINIDDNLILRANTRSLNKLDSAEIEVHNLEFGLALPSQQQVEMETDDEKNISDVITNPNQGSLVLRSNITNSKNDALVPGELLYSYNPSYFDVRLDPPQIQDHERLYYEPCSICKLASNDPLCRCSLLL